MTKVVADGVTKTTLYSTNLSCPSCVVKIEAALKAIPGVEDARVHFTTGRIVVSGDTRIDREALVRAVRAMGYDVRGN